MTSVSTVRRSNPPISSSIECVPSRLHSIEQAHRLAHIAKHRVDEEGRQVHALRLKNSPGITTNVP